MFISQILFYFSLIYSSFCYQCKNQQNEPVDWYVLYKLPQFAKSNNNLIKNGTAYMYITSDTVDNGWTLSSDIGIDNDNSIPALTLEKLFLDPNPSYILYNDQPPDKPDSTRGHTKGVVLLNSTHGLWLIHSVPRFPKYIPSIKYSYPKTGATFGQSFLCISLNISNVNLVAQQLYYNEPHIYYQYISEQIAQIAPAIAAVSNQNTVVKAPWYHVLNISSTNNQLFTSFAKSHNFNQDLYTDLVAPTIQSNLYTETWLNGEGRLPSNCSGTYEVDNIERISVSQYQIFFKSSGDHSKWAITHKVQFNELSFVCIGDINRAEHQKVRGGGTVCINNNKLWMHYLNIVASTEVCKRKKTKKHCHKLFYFNYIV